MSTVDIKAVFWVAMVAEARRGNVEAALHVLKEFADAVEQIGRYKEPQRHWSGPIPWVVADYLATAFRLIVDGTDPARALKVSRRRGRRKGKRRTK